MFKKGFTLAEVLITMAIIGIVSAVTIPSLMTATNQKALDNQKKAFQARLTNAITSMDALSGFGVFNDTTDNAAEAFVVNGLSKVYKLKQTCGPTSIGDCGIQDSYTTSYDGTLNMSTLKDVPILEGSNKTPAAFVTANGESVYIKYNRDCKADFDQEKVENHFEMRPIAAICAIFLYDLNGSKGPNKIGSDVGVATAFYRSEPTVVAPLTSKDSLLSQKYAIVSDADEENATTAAKACLELGDEYRVPDLEEAVAIMFFPQAYINTPTLGSMWASTSSVDFHDPDKLNSFLVSSSGITNYFAKSATFENLRSKNKKNVVCVR